jgi:dTDP-4-dehydrorhamnose reductase
MKIIVIGAKGQLGTTLAQTVPDGAQCLCLDLPEMDITRAVAIEALVARERPDVIINASAYTAVDRAEQEPEAAFAVNATGPKNLALAAKKFGCRLIHVSTDYVFSGTACTPYPPDAPCEPIGVYGRSKRQGEIEIASVRDDFVVVRTSWLYSRYGSNFVKTMLRLMRERDHVRVVMDQVGSPTWAGTLAAAVWAVSAKPDLKGFLHWSDAGAASWYDLAVAIQEEALAHGIIDRTIPIHPIRTDQYPTLARRPAYSVLDCSDAWRALNIQPLHWRAALRRMLSTF